MEEIDYEIEEREFEEAIKSFSSMTEEELKKVENFTSNDIIELIKMMDENLKDLSDLEISIDSIRDKIASMNATKERLNYQKDMTRKDIFEENFVKIILMYIVGSNLIITPDVIVFIKRIIVFGIIGFMSYDLNVRYFTSDYHKKKIKLTIEEIDKNVELCNFDIRNISKFKEMYINTFKIELQKYMEIADNNPNIGGKEIDKIVAMQNLLYE